jgi:tellurite resistance protein TerA
MDAGSKNSAQGNALEDANRVRGRFSGRGNAKGAAGYVDPGDVSGQYDFLSHTGEKLAISPPEGGFGKIKIGAAWNNVRVPKDGFLNKLLKVHADANVDLDLGCLYELNDGRRGAIQALGGQMGNFKEPPFIRHTGDERTGDKEGDDEAIFINGAEWSQIKRVLVYVYIYGGAMDWAQVKPQIQLYLPGSKPLVVTLSTHLKDLALCTIAQLENVRGGIAVTNFTEYFPGHAEMDRAFGFGIEWDEGDKDA